MPKSKNKKDHKKRVNARNQKIQEQKNRYQKLQKDFLMKMIEEEKNKGMYNNLPSVDLGTGGDINIDGPVI